MPAATTPAIVRRRRRTAVPRPARGPPAGRSAGPAGPRCRSRGDGVRDRRGGVDPRLPVGVLLGADRGLDAVPDALRRGHQLEVRARPRDRGHALELRDRVAADGACGQVRRDVVVGDRVGDREHRQRLVVDVLHSITSKRVRSRARLRWMWLFTVPRGRSSRSAISRWLRSSQNANRMTFRGTSSSRSSSPATSARSARSNAGSGAAVVSSTTTGSAALGVSLPVVQGVGDAVPGDADEPGAERGPRGVVPRTVPPGLDEDLLGDVLGRARVGERPEGEGVDEWRPALVGSAQSGFAPGTEGVGELAVVREDGRHVFLSLVRSSSTAHSDRTGQDPIGVAVMTRLLS